MYICQIYIVKVGKFINSALLVLSYKTYFLYNKKGNFHFNIVVSLLKKRTNIISGSSSHKYTRYSISGS